MKRILINATHNEEVRVALCKGNHLYDFDLENRTREQKKANIYKGHVTRVEPSLEAVFVEYGSQRQGFLPIREIANEYLSGNPRDENIRKLIKEGDELIVQVEKEERGNKGAALSTYISLAGRYLVLMPNNPRGGGISRQISGKLRDDMKRMLASLNLPKGMSVIIRTAGIGKTQEDLQHDLNHLLNIWQAIQEQNKKYPSPRLVHQEAGVVTRAVRDYLRDDISEIWIDNENAYNEAANFVKAVMPRQIEKLRKYTDYEPMFASFGIEKQIETAYQREVRLPSGGSIVIDQTEALVSIDINSAKSTKGSDVAETAYHTNLEAADEIARQLRLRDMGGLIVIDFIDMNDNKHQKDVEKRLVEATKYDRARVQFGDISKFGLMEMSRQRLRPSLEESTGYICPRCHGNGMIRDLRSLSLSIMRQIEQIALKERQGEVQAEVPTDIAAFLLNEKRDSLVYLEQDSGTRITILPHAHLESPHFKLHFNRDGFAPSSYERITDTQQQESNDLGYDVNWQTAEVERPEHQPTRQPQAKQKNVPANVATATNSSQSSTTTNTPSQPTHTAKPSSANAKPEAIAWLSNLFAPTPQAHTTNNVSSQDAAQAIEAIVNTGAQSRGMFGQVTNPTKADEKASSTEQTPVSNEQSVATSTKEDKKEEENSKGRKARHSRSSKAKNRGSKKHERQHDKHTDTASKTEESNTTSNKPNEDSLPKRSSNSKRDSRGSIERGETLTAANTETSVATQTQTQQKSHTSEASKSAQNQAENTTRKQEKTATTESPKSAHTGSADEVVLRVNESPVPIKEPEVVHLSLDNSKPVPNNTTDINSSVKETKTDVQEQSEQSTKDTAESTIDDKQNQSVTNTAITGTVTESNQGQSEYALQKQADSTAVNNYSESDSTSSADNTDVATTDFLAQDMFAERYVTAKEYGLASNDPRVVKARLATQHQNSQSQQQAASDTQVDNAQANKISIRGSVGEFITQTFTDGQQRIDNDGVITSFLAALEAINNTPAIVQEETSTSHTNVTNTDFSSFDFNFSNYGYAPLSAEYIHHFSKMTSAVATFTTTQGKTEVTPSSIGKRASNDPRGQHPDYQEQAQTAQDSHLQSNLTKEAQPATPNKTQQSIPTAETVGELVTRILGQLGQQMLAAGKTESAYLQALNKKADSSDIPDINELEDKSAQALVPEQQAEAIEQESATILNHGIKEEDKIGQTDGLDSDGTDNSHEEYADKKTQDKAGSNKTSIETYKSMIENVSEQLLAQAGLFNNLTAPKVPKSRSRKPKTEHKKPTQAEQAKNQSHSDEASSED